FDVAGGMGALVTVRVSRASAVQRAGRAGREAPGRVYRLWSAAEHDRLAAAAEPEIAAADLTGLALELACWGAPDGAGLALPDAPPAAAFTVAREALHQLGATDDDGRVTPRGRSLTAVGAHPRLARALLDGAPLVGSRRAAEVVAVLAETEGPGAGDDLARVWRTTDRWRAEAGRLHRMLERPVEKRVEADRAAGIIAGLAYPERLARAREGGYLMAVGTEADLAK